MYIWEKKENKSILILYVATTPKVMLIFKSKIICLLKSRLQHENKYV